LIADPVFEDPNKFVVPVLGHFDSDFTWGVYSVAYNTENRGNGRSDKTLWDTHHMGFRERQK
jgi:hypothetical protein